jgi:hypothetical protein
VIGPASRIRGSRYQLLAKKARSQERRGRCRMQPPLPLPSHFGTQIVFVRVPFWHFRARWVFRNDVGCEEQRRRNRNGRTPLRSPGLDAARNAKTRPFSAPYAPTIRSGPLCLTTDRPRATISSPEYVAVNTTGQTAVPRTGSGSWATVQPDMFEENRGKKTVCTGTCMQHGQPVSYRSDMRMRRDVRQLAGGDAY